MKTDSKLQQELSRRDDLVFVYCFGAVALGMCAMSALQSGYGALAMVLFCLCGGIAIFCGVTLQEIFRRRDRVIAFMQNVDPIFVHNEHDYPDDPNVARMRNSALEMLKLAGIADLKVYTLLYRDVVTTAHWWTVNEKGEWILKMKSAERQGIVVNETPEQFQAFLSDFKARKINAYRLELSRKNDRETIDRHVFNQDF